MLKKLATTFRFPNWWDSKIPPLLAFIYFRMIIADESFSFTLLLPVLLFLVWAISAAGFGHYVNDCFDIESDNIAGKPNQAANHSFTVRVLVSLSLTTSAIIPWFFLSNSGEIWIWVISHLVLFILYSAKCCK